MPDTMQILLSDLLIDAENPRLPNPSQGQREVLRALAEDQGKKLQSLAEDILEVGGLDPTSLPIVMPLHDDPNRYVVLEGNRRLAALRILENPDILIGADIPRSMLNALRRLSKEYHETDPIEYVTCFVVETREQARHWIELRHTGENLGVGVVPWSSDEAARFKARGKTPAPHIQVLDFLENRGDLSADERRGFPTTSLQRLVRTRVIQDKTGIEIRDGQLMLRADADAVAKAWLHIVKDLASGRIKTRDIYKLADRARYAEDLPSDIVVTPVGERGHGVPVSDTLSPSPRTKRRSRTRVAGPRAKLIPRDCVLNVTDARCRQIEAELRKLKIEEFPNAVSVLFRVFTELSTDDYITRLDLPASKDSHATLARKLKDAADSLVKSKKLTRQQATPVRHAANKGSFLNPSTTLMNQYVHNKHVFPAPSDLRAHWDSLQPFFIAIWAP